jgi:acetyl/propionyl-CoA carboxylase alpha subunit
VEAINGMGDKLESKRLAQAAGVNTIPGENHFSSPVYSATNAHT